MIVYLASDLISSFVKRIHRPEDSRGSPERFRSVGMEGPKMSVSRIPLRRPRRANASARFTISIKTHHAIPDERANLQL